MRRSPFQTLPVLAALLVLAGACASGDLGPILGPDPDSSPPRSSSDRQIVGEIQRADHSRRELTVDERGREVRIRYDADTRVIYQGQTYAPDGLEAGDYVRVDVRDDRGVWVTDYVVVDESRQERAGETAPSDDRYPEADRRTPQPADIERFTGRVEDVDSRRGRFDISTDRHGWVTVHMPYDAAPAERQEFDRLRKGDRVEFEAEWIGEDRVELVRFDRGLF